MVSIFEAVIIAKAEPAPHLMRGIHNIYLVPGLRRDDVWIPDRVSLARNDDPTPENVKHCESPGRAGGLP